VSGREATRGQPLKVFAVILGVWLIGRVLLWESPFPLQAGAPATARHWLAGPSPALPDVLARAAQAAAENAPGRRGHETRAGNVRSGPLQPVEARVSWHNGTG
jgi:hypothetical protein